MPAHTCHSRLGIISTRLRQRSKRLFDSSFNEIHWSLTQSKAGKGAATRNEATLLKFYNMEIQCDIKPGLRMQSAFSATLNDHLLKEFGSKEHPYWQGTPDTLA